MTLASRGMAYATWTSVTVWYPIWDAGLRLDHSVRTVSEALSVARGRP
ncbi:hypothetical protein ACWCO3_27155 [Micromonospora sp. NPDC002411]